MPVAAGVVDDLGMAARRVLAARDMAAERRRTTALDRTHHLQLIEAHMPAVGFTPSRTVVAENVRDHGPAWREANRGHVSLDQLKVMSAIERCRTAALGGHVARCENAACGHTEIAYNSCRNRHCPKCKAAASRPWPADRDD